MTRLLLDQALASLGASWGRALVVVLGLSVALGLPLLTAVTTARAERAVWARAEATPLVVGAPGSETDLVLAALGFRGSPVTTVPYGARRPLQARGDLRVVPLVLGHTAQGRPVVGTSGGYLEARQLEVAQGRAFALLGEVVVGSAVARSLELSPGDTVLSDPGGQAGLTGAMSTLLQVVGVLEASGTPDDGAVFTDVKTAWLLAGELHGHAPVDASLALPGAGDGGAGDGGAEDDNIEASVAVFMFTELSPETRAGFHTHGELDALPLSGMLLFPQHQRAHDQVLAELLLSEELRVVRPTVVVARVVALVARVQRGLGVFFGLVLLATVVLVGTIVAQDWRLRLPERRLLERLGAPAWWAAAVVGLELGALGFVALMLAGLGAGLGAWAVDLALRGG